MPTPTPMAIAPHTKPPSSNPNLHPNPIPKPAQHRNLSSSSRASTNPSTSTTTTTTTKATNIPSGRSAAPTSQGRSESRPGVRSTSAQKGGPNGREPLHLPLYRRVLFPTRSLDEAVPGFVVAPKGDSVAEQLNERLHHLTALAIRGYIQSWYNRISPRDKSLPSQVNSNIIHPILSPILTDIYNDNTRVVDWLLLEVPVVLGLHIETYWGGREGVILYTRGCQGGGGGGRGERGRKDLVGADRDLGEAYHSRIPLLAVIPTPPSPPATQSTTTTSSDPAPTPPPPPAKHPTPNLEGIYTLSPLYITALSDSILRLHLPSADYASPTERIIIREILGRSVLGSIARRVGEGWFWFQIGLKILGEGPRTRPTTSIELRDEKSSSETSSASTTTTTTEIQTAISTTLQKGFHLLFTLYSILLTLWSMTTSLMATYSAAPPYEEKYKRCWEPWFLLFCGVVIGGGGRGGGGEGKWGSRLILSSLEVLLICFGGWIDRLLPHLLRTHLLTPEMSFKLIDLIEKILFPDGYPGPSPVDPTSEEAQIIRRKFETRLEEVIPARLRSLVYNDDFEGIKRLTDPISDSGCNAHLVALLLDGMVAALIPQLVVSRIAECGGDSPGMDVATEQGDEAGMDDG